MRGKVRPFWDRPDIEVDFLWYAVPPTNPAAPPSVFDTYVWEWRERYESGPVGTVYGTVKAYVGNVPGGAVGPLIGDAASWAGGLSYAAYTAGHYPDHPCWPVADVPSPARVTAVQYVAGVSGAGGRVFQRHDVGLQAGFRVSQRHGLSVSAGVSARVSQSLGVSVRTGAGISADQREGVLLSAPALSSVGQLGSVSTTVHGVGVSQSHAVSAGRPAQLVGQVSGVLLPTHTGGTVDQAEAIVSALGAVPGPPVSSPRRRRRKGQPP
jgi:hypothetical protein